MEGSDASRLRCLTYLKGEGEGCLFAKLKLVESESLRGHELEYVLDLGQVVWNTDMYLGIRVPRYLIPLFGLYCTVLNM